MYKLGWGAAVGGIGGLANRPDRGRSSKAASLQCGSGCRAEDGWPNRAMPSLMRLKAGCRFSGPHLLGQSILADRSKKVLVSRPKAATVYSHSESSFPPSPPTSNPRPHRENACSRVDPGLTLLKFSGQGGCRFAPLDFIFNKWGIACYFFQL